MEELARFSRVETTQPPYHLFRREIEDEILPYAMDHDIGVLVYGAMAHGLLTGTMTSDTKLAPDDWRASSPDFVGETFRRNLAAIDAALVDARPVWGPHPEGMPTQEGGKR